MASSEDSEARFRYGVVFLLTLTLLVFVIVAPSENWSHAVGCALQWLALLTVVATSRAKRNVRTPVAIVLVALTSFTVVGEAAGALSDPVLFAISGLLSAAVPLALLGGLLRLVRAHGVTVQAVAGALTFYLLLGLLFAWMVGFASRVDSTQYFAETAHATTSQIVYFSFTVLTTTGFGDLTAASNLGRSLAVVEMLLGQLYLVTVIGVLVGNFAGRSRRTTENPSQTSPPAGQPGGASP